MASKTGWISCGELEIMRRISLVAVCCSSAFVSRARHSARCFSRSRILERLSLGDLPEGRSCVSAPLFAGFAGRAISLSMPHAVCKLSACQAKPVEWHGTAFWYRHLGSGGASEVWAGRSPGSPTGCGDHRRPAVSHSGLEGLAPERPCSWPGSIGDRHQGSQVTDQICRTASIGRRPDCDGLPARLATGGTQVTISKRNWSDLFACRWLRPRRALHGLQRARRMGSFALRERDGEILGQTFRPLRVTNQSQLAEELVRRAEGAGGSL